MRTLTLNTFLFLIFILFSANSFAQCQSRNLVKNCRKSLEPFKFSGAAESPFTIDGNAKTVEVEFTAYENQKYRLIFCSSGNFDEKVSVNVYDAKKSDKDRKKVYDNSSGIENLFWVFEPQKTGNYYIEYGIPSAANPPKEACMILVIGYQNID